MSGSGFSVKGLLAAVAAVAVGIYALMSANWWWAMLVASGTVLVFHIASLAVVCVPSPGRAFWLGFAIFGWGYLLIFIEHQFHERFYFLHPDQVALDRLHKAVAREIDASSADDIGLRPSANHSPMFAPIGEASRPNLVKVPIKGYFDRIGHCLFAWIFASVGGGLARHVYLKQRQKA